MTETPPGARQTLFSRLGTLSARIANCLAPNSLPERGRECERACEFPSWEKGLGDEDLGFNDLPRLRQV